MKPVTENKSYAAVILRGKWRGKTGKKKEKGRTETSNVQSCIMKNNNNTKNLKKSINIKQQNDGEF